MNPGGQDEISLVTVICKTQHIGPGEIVPDQGQSRAAVLVRRRVIDPRADLDFRLGQQAAAKRKGDSCRQQVRLTGLKRQCPLTTQRLHRCLATQFCPLRAVETTTPVIGKARHPGVVVQIEDSYLQMGTTRAGSTHLDTDQVTPVARPAIQSPGISKLLPVRCDRLPRHDDARGPGQCLGNQILNACRELIGIGDDLLPSHDRDAERLTAKPRVTGQLFF